MGRTAVIGNHLYFVPDGTLVDALTVGVDSKPDHDPETNWTDFHIGCVEQAEVQPNVQTEEVRCPVQTGSTGEPGGSYVLADEFVTQADVSVPFTLAELNPLVWQVMWLAADGPGDTGPSEAFTPLTSTGFIKGWAWLRQFDENNVEVSEVEVWSQLRINGSVSFQNAPTKVPMTLRPFANALNIGNLNSFF